MSLAAINLNSLGCLPSSYDVEEALPFFGESRGESGFSAGLAVASAGDYRRVRLEWSLNPAQVAGLRSLLGNAGRSTPVFWRPEVPPNSDGVTSSMESLFGYISDPIQFVYQSANQIIARLVLREDP